MMKGGHGPTKYRLNWGAFDHASHVPQLRLATITYMYMYMRTSYMYMYAITPKDRSIICDLLQEKGPLGNFFINVEFLA